MKVGGRKGNEGKKLKHFQKPRPSSSIHTLRGISILHEWNKISKSEADDPAALPFTPEQSRIRKHSTFSFFVHHPSVSVALNDPPLFSCQYYLLAYPILVVEQGIRLAQIDVHACPGHMLSMYGSFRQTVYEDTFR